MPAGRRSILPARRRLLIGLVSPLLVVSGLVGFPAAPAAAAPSTPASKACVAEQPTAAAATTMTRTCGKRVEVLDRRSEVAQTFVNPDGTQTLEESIEPVRVRHGNAWVPIDTTLKKGDGGVEPRAAALPTTLSAGGDGPLARLRDGKNEVSFSWPGRLPKPVLRGNIALYRDVLPHVDLQVTVDSLGFSELLIVRDRDAAADPRLKVLKFGLAAKGVSVKAAPGGGLVARDGKGKAVFTAPAPLMWDASLEDAGDQNEAPAAKTKTVKPAKPAARVDAVAATDRRSVMPLSLAKGTLSLRTDAALLADPATKFPVYIDPSVTGAIAGGAWTSVWSNHKTSSFWKNASALEHGSTFGAAGAGRTENCSGCSDFIVRSLFRMDTSRVRGKQILSATFRIEQRHAWTCSPKSNAKLWMTSAISSSTTWNNQPTWYGNYTAQTAANRKLGAIHGCAGTGTIEFNATSMVVHAAASNWSSLTVGLRAIDEGNKNQWKRFNHSSPKLAITYNTAPSAPSDRNSDAKGCATGASRPYVRTLTPTLAAKQIDPDNDQGLTTSFYWWQSGGSRSESNKVSQAAGNKTTVAKAVPAGKLADGKTYVWQARTTDAHATGAFSATCEFTVDVTAPAAPASVTSTDYPASTPGGGVGVPGQFTFSPPASGAADLAGFAWTLDQGLQASAATQVAVTPGQSVTVPYSPLRDGVFTMKVWTKDKAGWYSANPLSYAFTVKAGTGPAAEWSFDDTGTTSTDDSGHANTLTLSAAATRTSGRGGTGSAISLNGTSAAATLTGAITAPHPTTGAATPVRTDTSFTVSARVRLTATGGTSQATAVSTFGSRTSAYALGYSGPDNKWRFSMAGSDADNPALFSVLSNAAAVAGKWTLLTATYDASTKKLTLYIDGVAQTATATLTGGFNAATGFAVGKRRWNGADDGFFNGAVDDVRFYTFVPAASKIIELAAPLTPSLILPGGASVPVGTAATAIISAGGDTNVFSYKYSVDSTALNLTATPSTPGGPVTISVSTATAGVVTISAVSVDSAGRVSLVPAATKLSVTQPATLAGFVTDADFNPLPGAVVQLTPGGASGTAGADGTYTVTGFSSGTYTVTATYGGACGLTAVADGVPITGDSSLDLMLMPVADGLGYTCGTQAQTFSPSDQSVVALTGDDAVATVALPFAFPFYGQAYRSAWLDTNGIVSFTDPGGSHPYDGGTLPSATNPNAMVAPFWDDLVVDSSASVRTTSSGSGTSATFAIEWRNVQRKANTAQRVTFSAVLAANGSVTTNYSSLDSDAEKGSAAAVGIAAPAAEDGLTYSRNTPALSNGQAVVFSYPDGSGALELHSLSGKVLDMAGNGISGAKVTLDPTGLQTTTSTDGTYRFDGLVADTYTVVSAQNQKCPQVAQEIVELTADTVRDLHRALDYGGMGYACAQVSGTFTAAAGALALTGDDATTAVTLPFVMPFHGKTYTTATVSTNGFLTFDTTVGTTTYANPVMPTAAAPNAVVAPFWDDLEIDASASVRTDTIGTAPNRKFIVEWRNAKFRPSGPDRITFETVFTETTGEIAFNYGTLTTTLQQGAGATIGIENASGTVATLFSFQEARVNSNGSITFTPHASGTVSGSTSVAVTGAAAAGLTVTLNPGGRSTVTDASGNYSFAGVPIGEYTVQVGTGTSSCPGRYAKETVNFPGGTMDVDLSVMTAGDEFGYTCTAGATTFIPGTVTEDWTGDEVTWQKNPPFPIKLYGEAYTSAWINSNGLLAFKDPMYFGWIGPVNTELPKPAAEGQPDAAVYPMWYDWALDSASHIATTTTGTAPNRKWIVEWRNVYRSGDTATRATFETIFGENGTITFAYGSIPSASLPARGSSATVGIENTSGTIGFQYLYDEPLLETGKGVTFTPSSPGSGSITGTVSCEGITVAGATVAAAGQTTTTAADGTYRIDNVPAGTYAVIATRSGTCGGSTVDDVTVGTGTVIAADFAGLTTPAGAGYRLTEQPVTYTPADTTVLPITGDESYKPVTLPFAVTLYGQSYSTGYVDSNGLVTFEDPGTPNSDAWPIPSPRNPEEPNAAVYPFWHDWVVDSSASVRTATRGTAPNRQFVVEWRNVSSYEDPTTRTTFQVIFDEAGGYSFAYPDIDGTFLTKGGGATIGIENADGTWALQYTYRAPVLRPGAGLRFDPPQ